MKTLLCLISKDKQVENYNVFSSLEYIKQMLHNMIFHLDNVDSCMEKVEGFFISDYAFGDLSDPLVDENVQTPSLLSSYHD